MLSTATVVGPDAWGLCFLLRRAVVGLGLAVSNTARLHARGGTLPFCDANFLYF